MSTEAAILRSDEGTPVPLQGVTARGRLHGLLFELTVEQTYCNTGTANVEAVYTFPVPHQAVVLGLDLEIGERRLSGVAVRRQAASERYEEAMDEGNSAALLEEAGDGLYTLSLGNLLAGERAVIRYRYAQLLDRHEDYIRLCVATVIAPRYGDPSEHGLKPHQAPSVALLAAYPFSLEIDVLGDQAQAAFSSPSHPVKVGVIEGGMRVTLVPGAELDRDFVLQLTGAVTASASLTASDGDSFVGLVSLDTQLPKGAARPLSLKLVVDCSGSMAGDSIAQARRALLAVLDRLTPADAVSLTRFGSNSETLSAPQAGANPGWIRHLLDRRQRQPASRWPAPAGMAMAAPPTVEWLKHAVRSMEADLGGTELAGALQAAIAIARAADAGSADGSGNCQDLLLITDGEIWAVERVVGLAASSGHRLFVVAVGAAPAEGLSRSLGKRTGGAVEFVSPNEDIGGAIVRMFNRMREAPKRIAAVDWPVQPEWTAPLPAVVFSGDTLHLIAGFRSLPAGDVRVMITGLAAGDVVLRCPVAGATNLELLPRVAAARRLAALTDEEAAALAEQYQLVCKHTSFVVVQERAAGEKPVNLPELARVPQMLAAGWGAMGSLDRSFGVPMAAAGAAGFIARTVLSGPKGRYSVPEYSRQSPPSDPLDRYLAGSAPDLADSVFGIEAEPADDSAGTGTPATPRQVLESLLVRRDPWMGSTVQLLETLGVPRETIAQLRALATGDTDETTVLRIFVALLARSPAGTWLTAGQRAALEGDVFGNRELRPVRVAVQRLVDGVTEGSWSLVVTVV